MVKVWCLRDHRGNDFATVRVKSWAVCAEVCSSSRGCIAFSFEGEGGKRNTNCWLKKVVNQTPPKSSYIWSGTLLKLEDIPADKRKQWEANLAPRQPDPAASEPYRPWFSTGMPKIKSYSVTIAPQPASEPYRPWFSTGMPKIKSYTVTTAPRPKTTMMTTMVRKDGSGFFADTPGLGGPEVTLSNLALETSGLITDGPKATPVKINWAFAFDSTFLAKLKSQVAAVSTLLPTHPRYNAPPTGTVPPSISTKSSLEVYPVKETTSRHPSPVTTFTILPPPIATPAPSPPPVAAPTPAVPAVPAVPAQSTGVAPVPAVPAPWVVPEVQRSVRSSQPYQDTPASAQISTDTTTRQVLDCYKCGWDAPRAVLPRAIDFFCRESPTAFWQYGHAELTHSQPRGWPKSVIWQPLEERHRFFERASGSHVLDQGCSPSSLPGDTTPQHVFASEATWSEEEVCRQSVAGHERVRSGFEEWVWPRTLFLLVLILGLMEDSFPLGKPPANHFSEQDHARRLCH